MSKVKWYLGLVKTKKGWRYTLFSDKLTPIRKRYPQYARIVGPFKTAWEAYMYPSQFENWTSSPLNTWVPERPNPFDLSNFIALAAASTIGNVAAKKLIKNPGKRYIVTKEGMMRGWWQIMDSKTGNTISTGKIKSVLQSKADKLNTFGEEGISGSMPRKRLSKNPPRGAVEIYDDILEIRARKGKNSLWPGEYFKHKFTKRGSKIYGLPDGSLLVKGKHRLWKEFTYPNEG